MTRAVDAGFAAERADVTTGALTFVAYPLADYARADLPGSTHLAFEPRRALHVDAHAQVRVDGGAPSPLRAVEIQASEIAWGRGALGPAFSAHHARLVLRTGESGYSIAEAIAPSPEEAHAELEPLERALEARRAEASEGPVPASAPADADVHATMPRFSFAREGDLIVLRDYESRGPRERASRYLVFALVLLSGGIATGALTWRTFAAGGASTTVLGYAVLTAVVLVGAFAMSRIFSHARAYTASQTPIAWFGDDRVVVLPWVSRAGAVDRRPEGRLGAAIITAEIDRVEVHTHGELFAPTLEGAHGPIELARTRDRADADRVADVARLLLAGVASPRRRRPAPRA